MFVSLLKVIVQIPGAKNLEVQLPVVIGTSGLGMISCSIVNMSLLYPTFTLPDIAEGGLCKFNDAVNAAILCHINK